MSTYYLVLNNSYLPVSKSQSHQVSTSALFDLAYPSVLSLTMGSEL